MQKHTSAKTSINSAKLPRIYNLIKVEPWDVVLDYGCGRFTEHIRKSLPESAAFLPYDPYNQPQEVNAASVRNVDAAIKARCPVTVVCSNVLNVIDNDTEVQRIVNNIESIVQRSGGVAYFSIYEGDGTGNGRETMPDCYQRNEKTRSYLRFFTGKATVKNGVITVRF